MNSKIIQKYKSKSIPKLLEIAQRHFNKYIRLRDANKKCISCNSYSIEHASHYYSVGNYSALRFNENNVWGSCLRCNYFLHGNLESYRRGLIHRIGIEELEELEQKALMYKRMNHKWDRFSIIEVIEKYKLKCKEL